MVCQLNVQQNAQKLLIQHVSSDSGLGGGKWEGESRKRRSICTGVAPCPVDDTLAEWPCIYAGHRWTMVVTLQNHSGIHNSTTCMPAVLQSAVWRPPKLSFVSRGRLQRPLALALVERIQVKTWILPKLLHTARSYLTTDSS